MNQQRLILSYFEKNPCKDISHPEVVDGATEEYEKLTGKKFRDADRAIRKLHQEGKLIKVTKGVYRYEPSNMQTVAIADFDERTRELIFKRDNFQCVLCGRGPQHGVEIQADHIKPRDKGGDSTIANGQTLCGPHNYRKKNHDVLSFGLKFFENLHKQAKANGDSVVENFCSEIIDVFQKFDMK